MELLTFSQNGSWMMLQMQGRWIDYRSTYTKKFFNILICYPICRLDAALDLEYDITSGFTGSYFEKEIKGLADASGADEKKIRRIHMIGELTYVGNNA